MSEKRHTLVAEPGTKTIVMTRAFKAPPSLVFETYTKPEHLREWWGPCVFQMVVCEVDLRVGGAWRFGLRSPDGAQHGFYGEYREISPPARLVYSYVYEPFPDHPAEITVIFEARDGGTLVTETTLHDTVEARDGHLGSGMEHGAAETFGRLDTLLAAMQSPRETASP